MRQIAYFISAPGYLPYLVTSLNSLRRYYFGKVIVFAWPESYELAKRIVKSKNINAHVFKIQPWREHNGYLLQKIDIVKYMKGTTLFFDADTLITGSPNFLFQMAESSSYVGTQFGDWTVQKPIIRKRLERLRPYLGEYVFVLDEMFEKNFPSLNCGIYGSTSGARADTIREFWLSLSKAASSVFIPDECAQHVVAYLFEKDFSIWEGGGYNHSPKHQNKKLLPSEIFLWHGHGNMFARPDKCEFAANLWFKEYTLAQDIADMKSWVNEVGNRRICEFLKEKHDSLQ